MQDEAVLGWGVQKTLMADLERMPVAGFKREARLLIAERQHTSGVLPRRLAFDPFDPRWRHPLAICSAHPSVTSVQSGPENV